MATANQTLIDLHHDIGAVGAASRFIRTLVVDDTPAMVQVMSSILNEHPWVNVVGNRTNGLAAVTAVLAEAPDLVVMDLNMPVMNGLKATMHIKQKSPQTKVLLVSSEDDPEIALAAMDCGADGFIPKANLAIKRDWHLQRLFGDSLRPGQPLRRVYET